MTNNIINPTQSLPASVLTPTTAPVPTSAPSKPGSIVASASAGNSSSPQPATSISAAQKLLTTFQQQLATLSSSNEGSSPGEKVVALSNLMSVLANPKNQAFISSLDLNSAAYLRQKSWELVTDHYQALPRLFALACGLQDALTNFEEAQAQTEQRMMLQRQNQEGSNLSGSGSGDSDKTSVKPRLTRAMVAANVNEPIDPIAYSRIVGKIRNESFYLHSNPRIPEIVKLLHQYGVLSQYQLCNFLMNSQTTQFGVLPTSVFSKLKQALLLLKYKGLVRSYFLSGVSSAKVSLWSLERAGELYYSILTDSLAAEGMSSEVAQLHSNHTFGTNQVLAALAGACVTATRLGALDHLVRCVVKQDPALVAATASSNHHPANSSSTPPPITSTTTNAASASPGLLVTGLKQGPGQAQQELEIPILPLAQILQAVRTPKLKAADLPQAKVGCYLEMADQNNLVIGNTERQSIRPDAMGRIVYDSELVIPTIAGGAGLSPGSEEAEFSASASTGRQYWPFILEYDRGTETSEFFAKKALGYSELYNTIKTAWPFAWGNQFPTILVVTEASPTYLLALMTAVRTELAQIKDKNPARKRVNRWWFTTSEWFKLVFHPYLEPATLTAWYNEIYPNRQQRPLLTSNNSGKDNRSSGGSNGGNGRKGKASKGDAPALALDKGRLHLSADPRIWLPLDTKKVEHHELVSMGQYFKRVSVSSNNSNRPIPPPLLPRLLEDGSMRALPLPMLLNA